MRLDSLPRRSRGEQWWTVIRTARVCRRSLPLEAVLSYPVPGPGTLYLFHMLHARNENQIRILSRIAASVPETRIVSIHFASDEPLFENLPNEFKGSPQKYDRGLHDLIFDEIELLALQYGALENRQRAIRYGEALETLAGDDLMTYYRTLNPQFFKWMAIDERDLDSR